MATDVLRVNGIDRVALGVLLARYGLRLRFIAHGESIPGSFWGESEAGLVADCLYARLDTPVHSVLHEAAHYVCMTPERRAGLECEDAQGVDAAVAAHGLPRLQVPLVDPALHGGDRDAEAAGHRSRREQFRSPGVRWVGHEAGSVRARSGAAPLVAPLQRPAVPARAAPASG